MCLAGIDNFLFKLGYMENMLVKLFSSCSRPTQNVNSAILSLWSYEIGQTSPVQTVMKNHSETFIDLNRKLYYLLWTFLSSFVGHVISYIFFNYQLNCSYINGILLPKLFWPTVKKNCSSDRELFLKFEAEGRELAIFLLEQLIRTVKGQNNSWFRLLFKILSGGF